MHSPFLWCIGWHIVCSRSSNHVSDSTVQGSLHLKPAPAVVLLNVVPTFICAHALRCGCLHGLVPLYVSFCCANAALTRRSLRLGGWQYATRETLGVLLSKGGILQSKYYYHCVHWNTLCTVFVFISKYKLNVANAMVAQSIQNLIYYCKQCYYRNLIYCLAKPCLEKTVGSSLSYIGKINKLFTTLGLHFMRTLRLRDNESN